MMFNDFEVLPGHQTLALEDFFDDQDGGQFIARWVDRFGADQARKVLNGFVSGRIPVDGGHGRLQLERIPSSYITAR